MGVAARALGTEEVGTTTIGSSSGPNSNGNIVSSGGGGGSNSLPGLYSGDTTTDKSKLNGELSFPLAAGAAGADNTRNKRHSHRRSRDIKRERQFAGGGDYQGGSDPPSSSSLSPNGGQHLYSQAARPRKMRSHTSPLSEASTSAPTIFYKAKSYVASTSNNTSSSRSPSKKYGWKFYIILLIALIILGTFIVLRTVVHFFGTHKEDFITLQEVQSFTNIEALPFNADITPEEAAEEERQLGLPRELIPRIIHATWKNATLPEKWEIARRDCMAMLPDYDFKLWTDDSSREFIASEYPSFIPTWDSYRESFALSCATCQ